MYGLIVVLIILVALLLVLVVLAQNPKGGGLSSQFGGAGSSQIMGVKKTGDLLEKLTWGFAIGLLVLTMSTNFVAPKQEDIRTSPNLENAQESILPQSIQPADGGAALDLGEADPELESDTEAADTVN